MSQSLGCNDKPGIRSLKQNLGKLDLLSSESSCLPQTDTPGRTLSVSNFASQLQRKLHASCSPGLRPWEESCGQGQVEEGHKVDRKAVHRLEPKSCKTTEPQCLDEHPDQFQGPISRPVVTVDCLWGKSDQNMNMTALMPSSRMYDICLQHGAQTQGQLYASVFTKK